MNTLIAAGVDAAIVQDVGACRLIRELSPDFPIHCSTQMTITSAAGVAFARELGAQLVVLARENTIDEINRIPLKSQSAFLEGLQDRTVTVGKRTYELPAFNFAIATMNPVELGQGTFPLSEAATDRFAIMVNIGYLPPEEERKLVNFDFKQVRLGNLMQKERIIQALRSRGAVVGFLGDGVNDAPAMHAADASLAVDQAVDVARAVADFVLLERDLDDDPRLDASVVPELRDRVLLEPRPHLAHRAFVELRRSPAQRGQSPREIVAHGEGAVGEQRASTTEPRLGADDDAVQRVQRSLHLEPTGSASTRRIRRVRRLDHEALRSTLS